jgi:hypothetical protein
MIVTIGRGPWNRDEQVARSDSPGVERDIANRDLPGR